MLTSPLLQDHEKCEQQPLQVELIRPWSSATTSLLSCSRASRPWEKELCFLNLSLVLLYLKAVFSFCSKPVFWLWKMRVGCSLATTTAFLLSFQLQPGLFKAFLHTGGLIVVLDADFPHWICLHMPLGTRRAPRRRLRPSGCSLPQALVADGRPGSRAHQWGAPYLV